MRDLLFTCPLCSSGLAFDSRLAGQTLLCPSCQKKITVPEQVVSFGCPTCGAGLRAPAGTEGEFKCPGCGLALVLESERPDKEGRPSPAKNDRTLSPAAPKGKFPQWMHAVPRPVLAAILVSVLVGAGTIAAFTARQTTVSSAYKDAMASARNADPEAGIAILKGVVSQYPRAPQAGMAHEQIRTLVEAVYSAAFEKATRAASPEEAVKAIEQVMALHPDPIQVQIASHRVVLIKAEAKRKEETRTRLLAEKKAKAIGDYPRRAKNNKPEEMPDYVKECAELGVPEAQRDLGRMLSWGFGLPKDEREGVKWLERAAGQGDAEALFLLGSLHYAGAMGFRKDAVTAFRLYEQAAEKGHAEAQNFLGGLFYCGSGCKKNIPQALKWWQAAAEQGVGGAQTSLGMCLMKGDGLPINYQLAAFWLGKAAEQNDSKAQFHLARMYASGVEGIPKDMRTAVKWMLSAAESGLPEALIGLGEYYAFGNGVPKSLERATFWWRKAAEAGHPDGQYNLAEALRCGGTDLTADPQEAMAWQRKAAAQGHEGARQRLAEMENEANSAATEAQVQELMKDAGAVASAYVSLQVKNGVLKRASLLGYQRGIGSVLNAIYSVDYVSRAGLSFVDRQYTVSMMRQSDGQWNIVNADLMGVFGGLPLSTDWRQVRLGEPTPLERNIREREGW